MTKIFKWISTVTPVLAAIIIYACNTKLNLQPQGSLLSSNVTNNSGVQGLLIGAYALLSGENVPGQNLGNGSAASNLAMILFRKSLVPGLRPGIEAAEDQVEIDFAGDQHVQLHARTS